VDLSGRRLGGSRSFSERDLLWPSLLIYAPLAFVLSVRQRGYFNSDFVAYATLARRLAEHSDGTVTGYWSPLYSWLMVPLLRLGLSDLTAGRLVLLLAGAGYIVAIFALASRLASRDEPFRTVFMTGVSCCTVLQAIVWSTYLLDPDLLANALLFTYFLLLLDPRLPQKPWLALAAGLCAGLTYLAKAYMLPFIIVHLLLTLLLLARSSGPAESPIRHSYKASYLCVMLGLFLVAGPWMTVLSHHYHRLTFSTAGTANHANVSPDWYRQDPLWNRPLEKEYICEPHFGPDWSPFSSWKNFRHQAYLCLNNTFNGIAYMANWLAMLPVGALWIWRLQGRTSGLRLVGQAQWLPVWLALTGLVYCSGYAMIILNARYLVPTLAPLICLLGLTLFCAALNATSETKLLRLHASRGLIYGMLLVLPFCLQDLFRVRDNVWLHSQCSALSSNRPIAEALARLKRGPGPFAVSNWHRGLDIAYAAGAVDLYLGQPRATEPLKRSLELAAAGARTYLQFRQTRNPVEKVLPSPWTRQCSVSLAHERSVDIYVSQ